MRAEEIMTRLQTIGNGAYSTFDTLMNSYNSAVHCINNNIEGDFIECGVGAGSQIGAMAFACEVRNQSRRIWCYDSFLGIPMRNPAKEITQPAIGYFEKGEAPKDLDSLLVSSGVTVHSLENVLNNLNAWGVRDKANFVFVEGWFQKTLPVRAKEIDKIAILRLDGDLYESTKVCLKYLFPKLVSGGILIIDDWELDGCLLACQEYFGDFIQLGEINHIPNTSPVWFIKK